MQSDILISYLRTGVPAAWGLFITWLMSQLGWLAGLFDSLGVDPTSKQTGAVVTSIFFFLWYAFWRWVEKNWGASLPPILFKLALGSSQAPEYVAPRHAAPEAGLVSYDLIGLVLVVAGLLLWLLGGYFVFGIICIVVGAILLIVPRLR